MEFAHYLINSTWWNIGDSSLNINHLSWIVQGQQGQIILWIMDVSEPLLYTIATPKEYEQAVALWQFMQSIAVNNQQEENE